MNGGVLLDLTLVKLLVVAELSGFSTLGAPDNIFWGIEKQHINGAYIESSYF